MVFLSRLHNIVSRRIYRRTIALVQVVVMVMLAVPACCYELDYDHENASVSQTIKANNADHDKCPCCPDENKADSNNDTCSTCSYCTYYTPLTTVISINYDPSVAPLIFQEQFTKLTDVHIPIFVPPQNLT